ncbi:unnamed protein product [Meloidogyne enterolobii]|uniref:Uncharacterized protein n=1 Tax=Meloidogyne enterolobii TaxID=390850 RepID=A0ACB1B2W1_MELEN
MPLYTLGKSKENNLCIPLSNLPFVSKIYGDSELEMRSKHAKCFFSFRLDQFPATTSTGKATTRWTFNGFRAKWCFFNNIFLNFLFLIFFIFLKFFLNIFFVF